MKNEYEPSATLAFNLISYIKERLDRVAEKLLKSGKVFPNRVIMCYSTALKEHLLHQTHIQRNYLMDIAHAGVEYFNIYRQ